MALADIESNPDGNRARLQRVLNVGSTSNQALTTIMQGLGFAISRDHHVEDVGQARFEAMSRCVEMPKIGGGSVTWEFCDPCLLVARLVRESSALQELFRAALVQRPCSKDSPWRLLIGWDEFVPGNKLHVNNTRKCMNLVFSFVEFGTALHSDVVWFTPVCARSSLIKQVTGGWSARLSELLNVLLFSPGSMLDDAGVALDLGGERVGQLFAKPYRLLSDGDGLRIALQWRGHASTKPCWRHWNVLKKGCCLSNHMAGYVEIGCDDPNRFKQLRESEFNAAIDELLQARQDWEDGNRSKASLEHLQKAVGFAHTSTGLLANRALRSIITWQDSVLYDWVHTMLANGILTGDAWFIIAKCQEHGIATQRDVCAFLEEDWSAPRHRRSGGSLVAVHVLA